MKNKLQEENKKKQKPLPQIPLLLQKKPFLQQSNKHSPSLQRLLHSNLKSSSK